MKKNDLVAGKHVIEVYGNEKYFVCGNYLLSDDYGFKLLGDYNDDLIMECDKDSYYKVVRVYEIKQNRNLVSLMDSDNLKLVWERKEKLTYFEKQILGYLIYRFEYIARNKDDSLYVYNQEPEKHSNVWEIDKSEFGISKMDNITVFNLLFPMIKWSDEEPTLISALLNGCALMKYYISDLHFGHKNVLKFDNRPFDSVEEMNQTILDNWNNTIKSDDEVYLLGDIFWKNDLADEILPKLKGQKHLVLGNHDRINNTMKKEYVSIQEYKRIKDCGLDVILSHYPIAHWDGQFHGSVHLYGHIHVTQDRAFYEMYMDYCKTEGGLKFNAINVGCMMEYMGYTPRNLEYLLRVCGMGDLLKTV